MVGPRQARYGLKEVGDFGLGSVPREEVDDVLGPSGDGLPEQVASIFSSTRVRVLDAQRYAERVPVEIVGATPRRRQKHSVRGFSYGAPGFASQHLPRVSLHDSDLLRDSVDRAVVLHHPQVLLVYVYRNDLVCLSEPSTSIHPLHNHETEAAPTEDIASCIASCTALPPQPQKASTTHKSFPAQHIGR
eukprot:scaffold407_cov251-Pinguiococcus_pyrenoidosus.AAC.13